MRAQVESGRCKRIALVNDTAADVRDVNVEGPSGILAVCPPWNKPIYESSKRRVTWPNGAVAICYAAESPDLLRGPEHDCALVDELAKWKNLRKTDKEGGTAWDNLMMGLRIGDNPQVCVGTTPRPIPLLKELLKREGTVVTNGSSYENRTNLSDRWYKQVIKPYEGTRLGRQEIYAELLDDNPYALWKRATIEANRAHEAPALARIVVAVDPQVADPNQSENDTNNTGIVVAGITGGREPHGYILEDATMSGTPAEWARKVVYLYHKWRADRVVAEVNNGGAMVEFTIKAMDDRVSYKAVHASRGKYIRAEPVAALDEKGRVHHVGMLPELEDELCEWVPGDDSPDRLDARVWAITELMLEDRELSTSVLPSLRYRGIKRQ